jgi:nicotinamide riboside transporter PnuC
MTMPVYINLAQMLSVSWYQWKLAPQKWHGKQHNLAFSDADDDVMLLVSIIVDDSWDIFVIRLHLIGSETSDDPTRLVWDAWIFLKMAQFLH